MTFILNRQDTHNPPPPNTHTGELERKRAKSQETVEAKIHVK